MSAGDVIGLGIMFVGIIAIAGMLAGAYQQRLKFKGRELELFAGQTAEKAAQYAAHNERLEQRIRVLERITTDRAAGLMGEIEDLRDKPLN